MADQSDPSRKVLTTGVVLGLIGASAGAYIMATHDAAPVDASVGRGSVSVEELTALPGEIQAHIDANRELKDLPAPEKDSEGKPRQTHFLFSPELWQVGIQSKKVNTVIDILDPIAPPVHGEIPNIWFIKSGLSSAFVRADALSLDSDGDGFSNEEEYMNQTNPMDKASYPALIGATDQPKLTAGKVTQTNAYIIVPTSLSYATEAPEELKLRIYRNPNDAREIATYDVKPGDTFGVAKSDLKRFVLVGFEKKTFKSATGDAEELTAHIRDTKKPEGQGEYYVRAGRPRNDKDIPIAERKGRHIQDKRVVLMVTAGSALGTPQARFDVDTALSFTIPGHDKTKYTVQSIDSDGSVNIQAEGSPAPVNIPKAAPDSNP